MGISTAAALAAPPPPPPPRRLRRLISARRVLSVARSASILIRSCSAKVCSISAVSPRSCCWRACCRVTPRPPAKPSASCGPPSSAPRSARCRASRMRARCSGVPCTPRRPSSTPPRLNPRARSRDAIAPASVVNCPDALCACGAIAVERRPIISVSVPTAASIMLLKALASVVACVSQPENWVKKSASSSRCAMKPASASVASRCARVAISIDSDSDACATPVCPACSVSCRRVSRSWSPASIPCCRRMPNFESSSPGLMSWSVSCSSA